MSWIWLTLGSALLLGTYDVAKKYALRRNCVLYVLLAATALSTLFLSPFLSRSCLSDHLWLLGKSILVSASWIFGLAAMKLVPLTTVSTIKASRPIFIVFFSILIFGERLSPAQWAAFALVAFALFLLSRSSRKEGIGFTHSRGIAYMFVSVLAGVASALLDKHVLKGMEPLLLQSWSNLYITIDLAVVVLVKGLADTHKTDGGREKFKWDWTLLLIAVLITLSDALYFFALKQDDALLSVVSMVRRMSVVVTFVVSAVLFKEHQIRSKALSLALILTGVAILIFSSAS